MNAVKETKINQILQMQPSGAIFLSSWMKKNGISYELQRNYKKSAWFEPIGAGAVIRKGEKPTWQSALHSIANQTDKKIHLGGKSAMNIHGFNHYISMNEQEIYLFSQTNVKFPNWFTKYDWNITLNINRTDFLSTEKGLIHSEYKQFTFIISSPARAMLECLFLSNQHYEIVECYQILESLTTLHPKEVQELLENCNSVKAIRLFLFMAEKANHTWFKYLNISKLKTGKGKRMIVKNGQYIETYQITVPKELVNL